MATFSNGQYIHYDRINDLTYLFDFINDKSCRSNHKDYQNKALSLVGHKALKKYQSYENRRDYTNRYTGNPCEKKKRTYKNIYCHQIEVMIPNYLKDDEEKLNNYVREMMIAIDRRFKKLLYIYKPITIGEGFYIRILCFTRYVYSKKVIVDVIYKKDTYLNKNTGHTCKKTDPDAIKVSTKGQKKLDKKGNIVKEELIVSKKEERIFVYKGKTKFKKMINRFKKDILYAYMKCFRYAPALNFKRIAYKTMGSILTVSRRSKIVLYNRLVDELNIELSLSQNYLIYCDDRDSTKKEFNKYYFKLLKVLKELDFSKSYRAFRNQIEKVGMKIYKYREDLSNFMPVKL